MSSLSIDVLEQRIRDHQEELARLSVEYGDHQVTLTKAGERLAICEGELSALGGTLRQRLEEQARAEAAKITREASAELGETRRQLADVTAELEKASAAAAAATAAPKKTNKPKKVVGGKK